MGLRRLRARALVTVALLLAGAPALGSVQVEPIARVFVEGGYDSNVLYDGKGGDAVGAVSPDLGIRLRDRALELDASAGGDLLQYRQRTDSPVWNQRGALRLDARFDERTALRSRADLTYAPDPIGLARIGIFGRTGSALVSNANLRLEHALDPRWKAAGTFEEHLVRFGPDDGAAAHEPGVEVTRELTRRVEAGAGYRFDWFQAFGPTPGATAHELRGILRYRWARRATLVLTAGPALWHGQGETDVLPTASAELDLGWRQGGARLAVTHGVGLGYLATPGLFDSLEGGVTSRVGRHFELHADGGLWRSGEIPWGANGVLGYGLQGEVAWLAGDGFRVGLAASRFARADTSVTTYDRNLVGLRVGWEWERAEHR